ncbi:MAG: hypothetical protein MNPFHGCM_00431 [Gemmatimonadaceae bacterium]|nr:hypothetical protein [Gemmatimonadaceae bacterium]
MYTACLFCNKPLGRNESIEAFPVGGRLAFDARMGRLWVVCPRCERWNLTPLEERWEAIEQAERFFRDTRRRVSTDNIGLAKLRDGTTLVRIGEPLRPEFAAWRYGDQFGRRRRRQMLMAGAGLTGVGALIAGGVAAGVSIGGFGWMIGQAMTTLIHGSPDSVVATIRTANQGVVQVRRRHLAETVIGPGEAGGLSIDLRFRNGAGHFEGREAERIAAIVVPKVNRYGGNRGLIAAAVQEIEAMGSADAFLRRLAKLAATTARPLQPRRRSRWWGSASSREIAKHGLFALPGRQRLALEMALHEEAERRAMQGELDLLEEAWREAEEIAAISDSLLVPASIDSRVAKLKLSE